MNIVTIDQVANFVISCVLLAVSIIAMRKSHYIGFAIIVAIIALLNIAFYTFVILSPINEIYPQEFAIVSGVRTVVTLSLLSGLCIAFIRVDRP